MVWIRCLPLNPLGYEEGRITFTASQSVNDVVQKRKINSVLSSYFISDLLYLTIDHLPLLPCSKLFRLYMVHGIRARFLSGIYGALPDLTTTEFKILCLTSLPLTCALSFYYTKLPVNSSHGLSFCIISFLNIALPWMNMPRKRLFIF